MNTTKTKRLHVSDMHIYRNEDYFPSKPLKTMASVEILRIYGGMSGGTREKLLMASPNVTTLLMVENWFPSNENEMVSIDFQNIASSLPKLESFGWLICRNTYLRLMHTLDAAITGIPEQVSKELSEKLRNKDHLSAGDVASYLLRRDRASILDLKGRNQSRANESI